MVIDSDPLTEALGSPNCRTGQDQTVTGESEGFERGEVNPEISTCIDLTLGQDGNLDLNAENCQDVSAIGSQSQTGGRSPEGNEDSPRLNPIVNPEISTSIPVPKRYAHHGKRRRSYTDELFRCQFTDMISRTPLICNHLLWRNKPTELREHLKEHLDLALVDKMTDDEVTQRYSDAKRIFLEGIPEDLDEDDQGDETSE